MEREWGVTREKTPNTRTRQRAHRAVVEAARRYCEALQLYGDSCVMIEGQNADESRAAVVLALGDAVDMAQNDLFEPIAEPNDSASEA